MKRAQTLFFATVFAALLLESEGLQDDPWNLAGWYFHNSVKSWSAAWSNTPFVTTPLETLLILLLLLWLFRRRGRDDAYALRRGTLFAPVVAFAALLAYGVGLGLATGGVFNIALWETRGFLALLAVYFLTGMYVREARDLRRLVWVVLLAAALLAAENILRWQLFLRGMQSYDLAYDHVDSVALAFAAMLALAVWAFGGARNQRRFALALLPLILFALEVMKRRAAFALLAVGALALALMLLRLRPRLFWRVAPPVALVLALYLAAFWNNTGTLGQPARALSSTISPDPRDAASNAYRTLEKLNIQANIQNAPLTGLGFGHQYIFYYPLPDLSFWPFWHYTSHNAILWVWMKDGAVGYVVFWWLLGRGASDGARAVATRREVGAAREAARGVRGRFGARAGAGRAQAQAARADGGDNGGRRFATRSPHIQAHAPDARDDGGALALLVACVCLIPMQVAYSYVDLGLTSPRDMLLLGLALGLIARAGALLAPPGTTEPSSAQASQAGGRQAVAAPARRPDPQTDDASDTSDTHVERGEPLRVPWRSHGESEGTAPHDDGGSEPALTRDEIEAALAKLGGATAHAPPRRG